MLLIGLISWSIAIFCFINGYYITGIISLTGVSRTGGMIALIIVSISLFIKNHWIIGSLPLLLVISNLLYLKLFLRKKGTTISNELKKDI